MKINNATPNLTSNRINKNLVTFSASSPAKSTFKKLFDLERGGNMPRDLFLVNCFLFLIGGRVLRSRDNNEKREVLVRDVPTIAVVALSIPVIQKRLAKYMQENKGFALTTKEQKSHGAIKEWVAKKLGLSLKTEDQKVASSGQIKEWYQFDEKMATGFDGFINRLSEHGGNLKEIFSRLDEETKSKLANFSENKKTFIRQLAENKDLKASIAKKFTSDSNKALEQAHFLHTIPTLLGVGITLSLIGMFIPKFNIFMTAKINKKDAMEKAAKEKAQNPNVEKTKSLSKGGL